MTEKLIPLSVPNIKGNEIKYVTDALEKEWVSTGGAYINQMEEMMAEYLGTNQAVACQSGTAGLHMALMEAGVNAGDAVIVPTLTFIAAVNPVKYLGASPIFMDCDETLCMDMEKVEEFCQEQCHFNGTLTTKKTGKTIKAMIVVHVFGNMAKMEKAKAIARKFNLYLIEDATEALGTRYTEGQYKGKYAGTIGDAGVYSFNGNKIITTGGGGMMVYQKNQHAEHAKYLSTQAKDDAANFLHNEIGYNYRMTNIQAAIGVAQLERLEEFIAIKARNYHHYRDALDNHQDMSIMPFGDTIRPNYWFYALKLENDGLTKKEIIDKLAKNKIQTRPIWGLIHEQKPYQRDEAYRIEKASEFYKSVINIPCSTNLQPKDIDRIVEVLKTEAR